jgi:hypothetical protein
MIPLMKNNRAPSMTMITTVDEAIPMATTAGDMKDDGTDGKGLFNNTA